MGRKRKAGKAEGEANANENFSIHLGCMENVQTSPTRITSGAKDSKSENVQAGPTISEPKDPKETNKKSKDGNGVIRRSGRLRSLHKPEPNSEMIVEEINLVHSEQEEQEEEPPAEEFDSDPPSTNLQRLENKIDFLVLSVQEFKSEPAGRSFPSEAQHTEITYRSLYFESQKKIEELTKENHELAKSLEYAKGKLEALEKMNNAFGNLKDIALMTNLGRTTEAIVNLTTSLPATAKFNMPEGTIRGAPVPPALGTNASSPAASKKYARRKK